LDELPPVAFRFSCGSKPVSSITPRSDGPYKVRRQKSIARSDKFLCECADTNCVATIELSISEYESIRSSPVRFPVKLGHDYPEFERVVEEREHYVVVEKFGEAAAIVKKLDARSCTT
jgi:hypothetical protein